jgi:hypothetical protein
MWLDLQAAIIPSPGDKQRPLLKALQEFL